MRHLWLADALRGAGLKVVEVSGWKSRGADSLLPLEVVIAHHTATPASRTGNYPSLEIVRDGRDDLPGPLSQLGLGRDGTWYVIASGKANHAGEGNWQGTMNSRRTIGIEAEHPGLDGVGWPSVQLASYQKGVAALLAHEGLPANRVCGHKEWAEPDGRKIDPNPVSMSNFRTKVANYMTTLAAGTQTQAPEEDYVDEIVIDENNVQYVVGAFGARKISSMAARDALVHYGYARPGDPRRVTKAWVDAMNRATVAL